MVTRRRTRRRTWYHGIADFSPKEWFTLARQILTILGVLAAGGGVLRTQQDAKEKQADDASQTKALYTIVAIQQVQIDSLKVAVKRIKVNGKRVVISIPDGPPMPMKGPDGPVASFFKRVFGRT